MNVPPWPEWKRQSKGNYWTVRMPDHPNASASGMVLEHRLVMENHLGRLLEGSEIVHHVDGNTKNNDPSNLEVMSQADHARRHMLDDRPAAWVQLVCHECGAPFERRANQRPGVKGYKNTYCSRRCSGTATRRLQLLREREGLPAAA